MKSLQHKIKFILGQKPWRKTPTEKLQEEMIKEGFSFMEIVGIIDEKIGELVYLVNKKNITFEDSVELRGKIYILEWLKEEIQNGTTR